MGRRRHAVQRIPFVRCFIAPDTFGATRSEFHDKIHEAGENVGRLKKAVADDKAGRNSEDAASAIQKLAPKGRLRH
jgi:hypothetical protein